MNKLNEINKIHFIGIGGVSMIRLAEYASNFCEVSGSDAVFNEHMDRLHNVYCYEGENCEIVKSADLVVYTSAIASNNSELQYALKNKIKVLPRGEFLSLIAKNSKNCVAVAGTHGKTTTSAMVSHILCFAKKRVFSHFGGDSLGLVGNDFLDNNYFITEACEYQKNFLSLNPNIGVVLNVDYDHPDSYDSLENLQNTFAEFCNHCNYKIVSEECKFIAEANQNLITFGFNENSDYCAKNIVEENGKFAFDIYKNGRYFVNINLAIYGKHNILNALASVIVADLCGTKKDDIKNALSSFCGVARRFECLGKTEKDVRVIVDYAHHPKEIAAAIDTAKQVARGNIFVVFEPHTYSRTKALFNDFIESLYWADTLVLLPTFPARESYIAGGSGYDLYANMIERGYMPFYITSYEQCARFLNDITQKNDIILILGAGKVNQIANLIFSMQRKH